jgi:CRP/FNR family transcriptional regulator, cyclic AMP receptor protein
MMSTIWGRGGYGYDGNTGQDPMSARILLPETAEWFAQRPMGIAAMLTLSSYRELFPALSPEDLAVLARCGAIKAYPRNTMLFQEGQPSADLYIVVTGQIKVFVSEAQGKEVTLTLEGPGGYFGELGLVDEAPRSASVMTTEPSQLVVVSKADFQRCLAAHPDLGIKLMRALVQRVRTLTERVKSIALLDVYGRVAQTLQGLAVEQSGRFIIERRVTHQDIASMVGASREMVSRIMRDLVVGGYIEMQHKHIRIKEKLPAGW